MFVREGTVSSHQNPALDWNEGRSPMFQVPSHQLMHPLINPFKLSVVLAPAMFHMDKDVVCGHAAEVFTFVRPVLFRVIFCVDRTQYRNKIVLGI